MRATLIERDELVFCESKQNAGICFCRISEQLVSAHRDLVNIRNGDGQRRPRKEVLRQFSPGRRTGADKERERSQAEKLRELPSSDIAVLGAGNREVAFPVRWHLLQFPHMASSVMSGTWVSDSGMNERMSKSS